MTASTTGAAAPRTLRQLAGAPNDPPALADAALVLIDCQNEYVDGRLALPGVAPALAEVEKLLAVARAAAMPIFHIAHRGQPGGLFDRGGAGGAIADAAAPAGNETVIEKGLPNAFAGTSLQAALQASGRKQIVVAGFMTHMCVSSTVRAALDLGYGSTVVARGCATRDLPAPDGGVVGAAELHRASLAALSDRFALIVADSGAWQG
ncbi:cysteine hydrolase family protein [Oceanibacterium hippocampi]|uniref:Streptothricin hydrolase n=1 Tax=Oceanibacterium hippocampi TaxID=745714 RepID=A0A1Y5RUI2_9PROT|nr:cysteine hydrolase family protein [Oceanibacterium hippocampi]SLN24542.1 Streptothricin hydrolase [Oceanibacterium hippocampi]